MATTIVPAAGNAPLVTQQGTGTTPGYTALDLRRTASGSLQEGVYGTTSTVTAGGVAGTAYADFMVTQRNAGANMSVDINMPAGGGAWVQGDTIDGQGLYYVPVHGSAINEAIATADSSNPRVDIAVLEVLDNVHDASGGNLARVRILTGTPSVGATLENRTNAPTLPGSALLLADILVPASDTTIGNAQIRDRRKWARGAYRRILRNSGSYTTASGTFAEVDATNLKPRVECSGAPVRLRLMGSCSVDAAGQVIFTLYQDGVAVDGATAFMTGMYQPTAGQLTIVNIVWDVVPAAGSHLFSPAFARSAGTGTLNAAATTPLEFTVEEIIRQDRSSDVVTTG